MFLVRIYVTKTLKLLMFWYLTKKAHYVESDKDELRNLLSLPKKIQEKLAFQAVKLEVSHLHLVVGAKTGGSVTAFWRSHVNPGLTLHFNLYNIRPSPLPKCANKLCTGLASSYIIQIPLTNTRFNHKPGNARCTTLILISIEIAQRVNFKFYSK